MTETTDNTVSRNGTIDPDTGIDRVYGGDPELVHVPDGLRGQAGMRVAKVMDHVIRSMAAGAGKPHALDLNVCPGCYMIVIYNAAVAMAKQNGQSLHELGYTMAKAFKELGDRAVMGGEDYAGQYIEEIEVVS